MEIWGYSAKRLRHGYHELTNLAFSFTSSLNK